MPVQESVEYNTNALQNLALNERLYGAFRRNGVEMTYPHLNVHVK